MLAPALVPALIFLAACGRPNTTARAPDLRPARDEFSVMTYNLQRYGLHDRNGDGQKDDPKPAGERAAVVAVIAQSRPDVLAVQEIGNQTVFEEFRYALRAAGLDYEHSEILQRGASELNLAVLSRFPIVSHQFYTDDSYSIGPAEIPVLRGFLEVTIEVNREYRFRLLVAHLKSKVFHTLGQTEMRRNEARLLNKHVRKILKENPDENVLVVGDLNDTFRSAALREITGENQQYLTDLRPRDEVGDVWTHFSPDIDQYDGLDYMLASRGMRPEVVQAKSRVVIDPQTYTASDHRPVLGVFKAREMTEAENAMPAAAGREEPPETE
jgi:endonuclease/exonuclease/phosphatase family metal-dependent hydrolase